MGLHSLEIRGRVNLFRLVGNRKSRQKARKGKKFFVVLLMKDIALCLWETTTPNPISKIIGPRAAPAALRIGRGYRQMTGNS
jgi:hypothetical protein